MTKDKKIALLRGDEKLGTIVDFDLAKNGLETTADICERAKSLKRIVVLGWDDENYFYSDTNFTNGEAMYIMEIAKKEILESVHENESN